MKSLIHRLDKKMGGVECYCRRFFQYEDVMEQLADLDRLM